MTRAQAHRHKHRGLILLVTTDFVAAAVSLPVALILLAAISSVPVNSLDHMGENMRVDWLFPIMIIVAFAISGFYRYARRAALPSTFLELKDIAFAVGTGSVLALALGVFGHGVIGTPEPAASQIITAGLATIVLVIVLRSAMRALRSSVITSNVLVVGSGDLADRIQTYLDLKKGQQVVGRVVDDGAVDDDALGTVADLPRLCSEHRVRRLIVAFPSAASAESVEILRSLQDELHISVVPRYFDLVSWRSRLTDLYGLPLLDVAAGHLSLWDRFIKRTFDVAVASLVLLITSPLLLCIAVAVKLTSPGSILFRQTRIGWDRKPFTIIKFRTMTEDHKPVFANAPSQCEHSDALSKALFEIRNKLNEQHRITKLGMLLRKTSLDELPQFINILLGHMSLVGPRPFVPHEVRELDGWAARRFEVRPGITGLWQVSGRNELSIEDLRRLDYLYVASWSMWWDVKIMWDTPRAMLKGTGAY